MRTWLLFPGHAKVGEPAPIFFALKGGATPAFSSAITGSGEVAYSVADVRLHGLHTLESFNILNFNFEPRSTDFSFTLDEIRLVPELSAALLALAAGAGLLVRRRRG